MTRYFCDGCDEEMTFATRGPRNQIGRIVGTLSILHGKQMMIEVITGLDGANNAGDFCRVCIAAALRHAMTVSESEAPR